jgi:endo-1,4-beta-xylanase
MAIMSRELDQPALAQLIASQVDCLTAENELKPQETEPRPGVFDFAAGDKLLAFTRANGMKLIGHTLCWHRQSPGWMYQGPDGRPLPRDQALANLKRHIDGVMGHFKGQVLGWDVVNEAIADGPADYLRDSPARRAIGDDFVEQAFQFAHAADPGAELYYNDYDIEQPAKRAKAVRLIRELKARGCRVDAVGIQGHWALRDGDRPAQQLEESIVAFAALGVRVSVSELDLDMLPRKNVGALLSDLEAAAPGLDPYAAGLPADVADRQADFYAKVFRVVVRHRDVVERVTFWGTHDGTSWLNDVPIRGRTNYPLLWYRDLRPKPAVAAVIRALQGGG